MNNTSIEPLLSTIVVTPTAAFRAQELRKHPFTGASAKFTALSAGTSGRSAP
jgi:hypothetical protein